MPSHIKNKSLAMQKVRAYVKLAQDNENIWHSILVFLGAFFLLGAIPFYPFFLVPLLAAICALMAFRAPPAGVLASMLLALPAIAYQSPLLSIVFVFFIAIVLFEMFENWMVIATLQILIMAPFSFGQSFFGWISILGMITASFYFGSRKSLLISIPSVLFILFLSAIWLVENSAFLPVRLDLYRPGVDALLLSKPQVELIYLPSAISSSLYGLLSYENLSQINPIISHVADVFIKILLNDSGFIQLIAWSVALYLVGYLPSLFRHPRAHLLSSLAVLTVLPFYYLIGLKAGQLEAIAFSIAVIGILENFGVKLSRETEIKREERQKSYGKFGLQDMGLGTAEKSMDDIGDYEDVKQELHDAILMPLEKKELAYAYGIKPPSGILLFGPPGTGKTMLMRALAKELRYGFYYIKSSDILSQWYGESEKNTSEIFSIARKNAPSVLFFDEIDSIGKNRTSYSADDVGPRVLSVLLQEMDGLKTGKPVLVVGATNVPQQLDPALLRPGRFDKIIYMHLPEKEARVEIFKVSLKNIPIVEEDIDFDKLAAKTERFSGADIKNIVNEAIKIAAKEASGKGMIIPVSMEHLLTVIKNIKPSTSIARLEQYETFRMDFERRVGGKGEKQKKEERVVWGDIIGLEKVKKALLEAIELPLLHEKEMKELKIKPSKGILLFGPPGTGKTLIAKAASSELNASFQVLSGAELMKEGYTQSVTVIKEAFNRARENAPSIIFVDEIETFAPARGAVSGEILGQFLTEMDGVKEKYGVVVMAATNKPSLLDSAMLRPGRFDKIFYIPPPSEEERNALFQLYLGTFAGDVDLTVLVGATKGFSGADITSVCQEVKMGVLREKIRGIHKKPTTISIMEIIKTRRPSITKDMLDEFEAFIQQYGERI